MNDTIKVDLETGKAIDTIKFEIGNVCMIARGRNAGRVGIMQHIERYDMCRVYFFCLTSTAPTGLPTEKLLVVFCISYSIDGLHLPDTVLSDEKKVVLVGLKTENKIQNKLGAGVGAATHLCVRMFRFYCLEVLDTSDGDRVSSCLTRYRFIGDIQ